MTKITPSKPIAITGRSRRSSAVSAMAVSSPRDRTPPKANGIDGFMFASPVRNRKLSQNMSKLIASSPSNSKTSGIKWIFSKETTICSVASTSAVQLIASEPKEDRSPFFSPYHCQPVRHRYNLRSRVYHEQEKFDENHMEIRHFESIHVSIPGQTSGKTHIEEEISKIELEQVDNSVYRKRSQEYVEPLQVCDLDISDLDTDEAIESFHIVKQLEIFSQNPPSITNQLLAKDSRDDRITLVLDLDETLVHCSTDAIRLPNYDLQFDVHFQGRVFNVFVQKRPWVLEFLQAVSVDFEVVIFTASQQIYADKLLDLLDPNRDYTKLFRDSCVQVNGTFVKDLRILGRDLRRTIIVDNAVEAFSYQINNGIPIKSWFSEKGDSELPKLANFLRKFIHYGGDIRPVLEESFSLRSRISSLTNDPFV